jgi:DNA-binding NarL/FixJ family response regulator
MLSPVAATILLVDDHQFTRVTLGTALSARGCSVQAVASAREALALVADGRTFEVALLDLDLGTGPTGLDLAAEVRTRLPQIGVILLTSYRDPRLAAAAQPDLPVGGVYLCKDDIAEMETLMGAIELVRHLPLARRASSFTNPFDLTDVQVQVLSALAMGATTAQIARDRGVSEGAVEKTIARICERVGIERVGQVNQRVQLVHAFNELRGRS